MLHMHCIIHYIMYIVGMGLSIHMVVVFVGDCSIQNMDAIGETESLYNLYWWGCCIQ